MPQGQEFQHKWSWLSLREHKGIFTGLGGGGSEGQGGLNEHTLGHFGPPLGPQPQRSVCLEDFHYFCLTHIQYLLFWHHPHLY